MQLNDKSSLSGYDRINVIVGKNGSGKSTLLRRMDESLSDGRACVRYITPERGGVLIYDGSIATNQEQDSGWITGVRRQNRFDQFRQSSVMEFRNLETLVLRSIEKNHDIRASEFTFDSEVARINEVLDRVKLIRSGGSGFDLIHKETGERANARELSSGESELISLSIEILYFSYLCKQEKYKGQENWLLLDEPDVHLHPDLQHRLMSLLVNAIRGADCKVAIATHSSTILASLLDNAQDLRVGFKDLVANNNLVFRRADDVLKSILPMFGAHPLSNVFNKQPPLILEGEDDERIWQAAVRRSQGRIRVFPCVAGDIQSMNAYEVAASQLIASIYDDARAFSLRDRDEQPYEIANIGPVIRARLNCRAAENLLVTDDTLAEFDTNWETLRAGLEKWIADSPDHPRYQAAVAFRASKWDRQNFSLKDLRMVIVGITGSTKPWEVAVGQSIARLNEGRYKGPDSLQEYLGPKIIDGLRLLG
ncbi:AAA family ATPase [Ensifer adhaerens]|uniref:AAA family ATPase n=1 Tax=Ensifer adhaerens TaxID=106592 RepID=UPI000DC5E579|nr:AAA family ATPase [Ensifer adhaerens]RAS16092.1 putative AbiEii toxin of type IV toxin-antitoxin system [Ensifer adhaerens]